MARLGELLVAAELLTTEQLDRALRAQVMWGARLGTNLIELGFIDLDTLSTFLAQQHQRPAALARHFEKVDRDLQRMLHPDLAEMYTCLPLVRVGGRDIVLASSSPLTKKAQARIADELDVDPERIISAIAAELRMRYQLERVYNIQRPARFMRSPGKTIPPFPQFDAEQDASADEIDELLEVEQAKPVAKPPEPEVDVATTAPFLATYTAPSAAAAADIAALMRTKPVPTVDEDLSIEVDLDESAAKPAIVPTPAPVVPKPAPVAPKPAPIAAKPVAPAIAPTPTTKAPARAPVLIAGLPVTTPSLPIPGARAEPLVIKPRTPDAKAGVAKPVSAPIPSIAKAEVLPSVTKGRLQVITQEQIDDAVTAPVPVISAEAAPAVPPSTAGGLVPIDDDELPIPPAKTTPASKPSPPKPPPAKVPTLEKPPAVAKPALEKPPVEKPSHEKPSTVTKPIYSRVTPVRGSPISASGGHETPDATPEEVVIVSDLPPASEGAVEARPDRRSGSVTDAWNEDSEVDGRPLEAPNERTANVSDLDALAAEVDDALSIPRAVEDEGSADGRERRRYVRTIGDAPTDSERQSQSLGRIAIRKVAVAKGEAEDGRTLGEATRAIRRATNRDRVADLCIDTLFRFAQSCAAASLMVVRGQVATTWKGFIRDGSQPPEIAVPLDQPGLIPKAVHRCSTVRAPATELGPIDQLLMVSLAQKSGDMVIVPISIAKQVMCVIALVTDADAPIATAESVAAGAGAAFARLMRDASR